MANNYKPGRWSGTLEANLIGDASKTTPTLGDDFDSELANLQQVQAKIVGKIEAIKKEITALKNHPETGRLATSHLSITEKKLVKINDELSQSIKGITNQINKAQKAEWARFRKILLAWEAAQAKQTEKDSASTGTETNSSETSTTTDAASDTADVAGDTADVAGDTADTDTIDV